MTPARLPLPLAALALGLSGLACGDSADYGDPWEEVGYDVDDGWSLGGQDDEGQGGTGEGGELGELTGLVHHDFGPVTLAPFQEISNCVQWTVDNDAAVYVQAVTLNNHGYFHHSNWFAVPEHHYAGPDGFFDCEERSFEETSASVLGPVLFAQSTQSFSETQRTQDGAVIKIPRRHKVIATTHLLNVGPAEVETELAMSLELVHPSLVETQLSPMRLTYLDLDIPAQQRSRFTGACEHFGQQHSQVSPQPIVLHHALAHFHGLGESFELSAVGGELGTPNPLWPIFETLFELEGFTGDSLGKRFDPPVSLEGIEQLRFGCGFDNWRDVNVGWGIGDQEMCVMLALVEADYIPDVSVVGGTEAVGQDADGVIEFEGPCAFLALPKSPDQGPPSVDELLTPLYLPPSDEGIDPAPDCVDHDPLAEPSLEPSLSNVAAVVFQQSCAFNACHGASAQAAGLNLQAPDLHAELLDHEVLGNPGASLIEPGDPEASWLYELVSSCSPGEAMGLSASSMPLNAPVLLDDASIALVREWIAAGAPDD
ncbi:hypothetical protein PPSIR1_12413 [Plesiocystis pacifica SIR-1]|uniref:Uncharacterized protein n=2 Tax=Plesiocystis pacifica TaxID=191768 RepID=A6GKK6_9BACT|nr:hypothetical protein PPSIR1_12413 [Plesiocystis pacifica SIR-1]